MMFLYSPDNYSFPESHCKYISSAWTRTQIISISQNCKFLNQDQNSDPQAKSGKPFWYSLEEPKGFPDDSKENACHAGDAEKWVDPQSGDPLEEGTGKPPSFLPGENPVE